VGILENRGWADPRSAHPRFSPPLRLCLWYNLPMTLISEVQRAIQSHKLIDPDDTVVVGVSGGPDSLCLLHVLLRLAPDLSLRLHIAHLNHGLRGAEADADAAFVQETAAAWGLPVAVGRVDVAALAQQAGMSLEEAARHARYRFLAEEARRVGARVIAVGHTADDQAETVLMHFLRGSGLAGLRGMQPASDHGFWTSEVELGATSRTVFLVRPLLSVTRVDVLDYCVKQGLTPRVDRSNEDTTFFRNRLRHELLPLLETYNPQIRRILLNSATVLADDYEQLRGQMLAAWAVVVLSESSKLLVVDLARFRALPISLQRSVLREAVKRLRISLRDVGFVHVENALSLACTGHTGDRMTLPAGLEVVLGYARLAIGDAGLDLPAGGEPQLFQPLLHLTVPGVNGLDGWLIDTTFLSPDVLPPAWNSNDDPWQAWLDADVLGANVRLRTRIQGERFQPLGLGGHSKPLAEFFTNAKVPASSREHWPLLVTADDAIAWVCGLRVDDRVKVTATTQRVLHVRFERQEEP
jgi:tRNA(Ile)-lysidine synthase